MGTSAVTRHPVAVAALLMASCFGCVANELDTPAMLHEPGMTPLIRPDTPGNNLQFNFEPGDVVETHGSPLGGFLIHFTRQGPNAVPAADVDGSGTPDFVEEVADVYDQVLVHYRDTLGFRAPLSDETIADNGGDGRFDVYLVDFGGLGDGHYGNDSCTQDTCAGYMVQENDYVGYGYPSTLVANQILGSHEFFHAVQAAYDNNQGSVFSEGTAVWATENFNPSLFDFEAFIPGYLDHCDRSLDLPLPGPVDAFSYGSALFFQFIEERYGDGKVRALWESSENGANGQADPIWFEELDPMLMAEAKTSFVEAFAEFATWNLFTGALADSSRYYANGSMYPAVKMTDVTLPFEDDKVRVFYASSQYYSAAPEGRAQMSAAVVPPADAPQQTEGLSLLVAVERAGKYEDVLRMADITGGTEVVDTSGADNVVVVVVNGLQGGESRQPALCIGSSDEVSACRTKFGGTTPITNEEPSTGGCGCRMVRSATPFGGFASIQLLLIALVRRRLRARKATRPAR